MGAFAGDNFLLETTTAPDLYHDFARDLPIIDYHCHLSPELMAADHKFRSITEVWLEGDHYKWRAMRAMGVPERLITGYASDWEKFEAWARTVPSTLGKPLYHWSAMELRRPFGIDEPLNAATARTIFDLCNDRLRDGSLTAMGILRAFRVAVVCTTDDPADSLEAHRQLAARTRPCTQVYPTWRPDKALAVGNASEWNRWVDRLGAADCSISNWGDFLRAIEMRHSVFHHMGLPGVGPWTRPNVCGAIHRRGGVRSVRSFALRG